MAVVSFDMAESSAVGSLRAPVMTLMDLSLVISLGSREGLRTRRDSAGRVLVGIDWTCRRKTSPLTPVEPRTRMFWRSAIVCSGDIVSSR